ncbi:hypothetical protein ALC60_10860 [Trachymyrmex zeteki]|uniref:Uncharacterized protein n=1 Tax=Mycetomoellerius zeteki TaxID=64791 RepID=A0A151WQC7_9HYME|nr:hypothetical protein ALC60_10860 [Trachymyrmex zeteki]
MGRHKSRCDDPKRKRRHSSFSTSDSDKRHHKSRSDAEYDDPKRKRRRSSHSTSGDERKRRHERFDRIQVCEAIDYIVRQARLCDVPAHHWSPGPFTKTSATGCKSYLNWRWQVYPSGRLTSESIGSLRGSPIVKVLHFIKSVKQVATFSGPLSRSPAVLKTRAEQRRNLGCIKLKYGSARTANEAKAASKDKSAARKPDGIVEHGLLTCDRIRIQTSSSQFQHLMFARKHSCSLTVKVYEDFFRKHPAKNIDIRAVMSPTKIKKRIYMYIGSLRYSVEASETSTPFCLFPSSLSLSLSLSLFLLLLEKGEEHARVPLKSVWNIIASTRVPVMEGFAFNFDNDRNRFRYLEKAGRNVALLSCAASRIRNLVNSPETVNSGTFDSPPDRINRTPQYHE